MKTLVICLDDGKRRVLNTIEPGSSFFSIKLPKSIREGLSKKENRMHVATILKQRWIQSGYKRKIIIEDSDGTES